MWNGEKLNNIEFFTSCPDYFGFKKVNFDDVYYDILYSSLFLMPLMSIFWFKMPRISAQIIYKYGEIAFPCLHPLPGLKYSDTIPFCLIV